MKFLPFENITYKTNLTDEECLRRLSEVIEPAKIIRLSLFGSKRTKPYEGEINGQYFNIKRIIGYRNSFLPRISGKVEHENKGATIHVKMQLHVLVIVFLCIWCGGLIFASFAIPITNAFNNFFAELLIPLGMLLFVYLMTMGGFKYESKKAKKDLANFFEAEIISK